MVDKKIVKLIVITVPLIMIITALSGCVDPTAIETRHWDHINSDGTGVRLWGFLKLGQNFKNWDAFFVYDTERHDNWELYEYTIEADNYDQWNFFSVDIYGLDRNTEYHYRAVGESKLQGAQMAIGIDRTFIPGGPRVNVLNASSVGTTSARLEGDLTHMGGAASCEAFFKYGTDPQNLNMETTHETMTSTGNFHVDISGLTSCQTYHYRAYASNDADTWQSVWQLTVTPGMPTIETYLPIEVTSTSAKMRGKLFSLGGTSDCDVWFEYGDDNPNNLDETTDSITMDSTGNFNIVAEGLTPATTYWVRAVANNGVCEHKGVIKEFSTLGYKGEVIEKEEPKEEPTKSETQDKTDDTSNLIKIIREKYPWVEGQINNYPHLKKMLIK